MRKFLIFLLIVGLSGCGKHEPKKAVDEFMKKVQAEAPPIPAPKPLQTENFATKFQTDGRDPFASLAAASNSKKYPNSILQQYTLDSLTLVGIVEHDKKAWALLRAPDEKIYRITVGNRIGNQQSLITKISGNTVFLETDQNISNQKKESTLVLQKK